MNTHAVGFVAALCCAFAVFGYLIAHRRFRRTVRYLEQRLDYLSDKVSGVRAAPEPRADEAEDKRRSYFTKPDMDRLRGRLSMEDTATLDTFAAMNGERRHEPEPVVITDATTGSMPVLDEFGRVRVHPRTTASLLSNGGVLSELSEDRIEGRVVLGPPGEPVPGLEAERDWNAMQARSQELHPWDDIDTMLAKLSRDVGWDPPVRTHSLPAGRPRDDHGRFRSNGSLAGARS